MDEVFYLSFEKNLLFAKQAIFGFEKELPLDPIILEDLVYMSLYPDKSCDSYGCLSFDIKYPHSNVIILDIFDKYDKIGLTEQHLKKFAPLKKAIRLTVASKIEEYTEDVFNRYRLKFMSRDYDVKLISYDPLNFEEELEKFYDLMTVFTLGKPSFLGLYDSDNLIKEKIDNEGLLEYHFKPRF